jgi:chromosome partitioning protein
MMRTKPNAGITAQSMALLSKYGQVAATLVADRTAYAAAMTDGRTAQELAAKGPAALEMAALWKNIKEITPVHAQQKGLTRHG